MLRTLDPHSSFLEPEPTSGCASSRAAATPGIGITIVSLDGQITVTQLFEGSPAYRAGIRRNDVIARVGQPIPGKTPEGNRLGRHQGLADRRGRQARPRAEGHDRGDLDPAAGRRHADRSDGRARPDSNHDRADRVHDRAGHRLRPPAGLFGNHGRRTGRGADQAEGRRHAAADAGPARQPRRSAGPGHRRVEPVPQARPDGGRTRAGACQLGRGLSHRAAAAATRTCR